MSSNDDILHLRDIISGCTYYVGLQVYYLSINELKSLTNLEKYFMSSSRRPRLVAALLFFCKFEYDNYKFMQCILFRCLKCTKFAQLILRKIVKIVATSCQILRLKCTTFDFGWGSAPDPTGGAYSAPPDPLAALKGAYF